MESEIMNKINIILWSAINREKQNKTFISCLETFNRLRW